MSSISKRVAISAVVLLILGGAVFGVHWGWSYLFPPRTDNAWAAASPESLMAWNDHRSVASWLASCLGVHAPENLPDAFRLPIEPSGMGFNKASEEQTRPNASFTRQQLALYNLSNQLFMQRVNAAQGRDDAFKQLQLLQIAAIAIGMVTTILISVTSTEIFKDGTGWFKVTLRMLAIIFPAVGTAVAAINTFYDPNTVAIRNGRVLDSVSQLHSQIALSVWHLKCTTDTDDIGNPNSDAAKNWVAIDQWITANRALFSSPVDKSGTTPTGGTQEAAATGPKPANVRK